MGGALTAAATWSSAAWAGSRKTAAWPPATRSWPSTTSPSSQRPGCVNGRQTVGTGETGPEDQPGQEQPAPGMNAPNRGNVAARMGGGGREHGDPLLSNPYAREGSVAKPVLTLK